MNRAERRRAKKKGLPIYKEPVYQVKQSDIKRMRSEDREEAIDTANDSSVQSSNESSV